MQKQNKQKRNWKYDISWRNEYSGNVYGQRIECKRWQEEKIKNSRVRGIHGIVYEILTCHDDEFNYVQSAEWYGMLPALGIEQMYSF